uniref:Putative secreted protein n=1 Tax=Anopheles darlingi TaxID=43151 RepID=A0A2M4DF39_ANODA
MIVLLLTTPLPLLVTPEPIMGTPLMDATFDDPLPATVPIPIGPLDTVLPTMPSPSAHRTSSTFPRFPESNFE